MLFGLHQFNLDFHFLTQKSTKSLDEETEKLQHSQWSLIGSGLVGLCVKLAFFPFRSDPQPQLDTNILIACRVATSKQGRKKTLVSLVNCAGCIKKTISFLEEDQNNWFVRPSIRGNTWELTFICLPICQDSVHFKPHKSFQKK